jgi:hypothetical protein
MAKQAGIHFRELSEEFATGNGDGVEIEQMQAFAKLVAEKATAELRADIKINQKNLWQKLTREQE